MPSQLRRLDIGALQSCGLGALKRKRSDARREVGGDSIEAQDEAEETDDADDGRLA